VNGYFRFTPAALVIVLLAACTTAASPPPTTTPEATASAPTDAPVAPVTLKFWVNTSTPDDPAIWTAAVARYEAKNPHVTIELTPLLFEDFLRNMPLALDAGTAPDIASSPTLAHAQDRYVKAGKLLDLTEIAASRGWTQNIDEELIAFNNPTVTPRIFGVPWAVSTVGVFYNKTMFDSLGLTVPTTMQEFVDVMAALATDDIIPVSVGARDGWPLAHLWYQLIHTSTPYDHLTKLTEIDRSAAYNIPSLVQSAQTVADWYQAGYLDRNMLTTNFQDASAAFVAGRAAMTVTGAWQLSDFSTAPEFEARFFPMPQVDPTLPWHVGGQAPFDDLIIPLGPNQDAAVEFMDYLLSEENMTMFWNDGQIVPFKFATPPPPPTQLQGDFYAAIQRTLPGYFMDPYNAKVGDTIYASLQDLVSGNISAQEAMDKVQAVYLQQSPDE
jgi:raffinose/stachyose/melibiose transport system substrate-binding protein